MKKRALTLALTLALAAILTVPAAAYDTAVAGQNNVLTVTNLALSGHRGGVVDRDHTLWVWGMFDYSGYYVASVGYYSKGGPSPYKTPTVKLENIASVSCGDDFDAVLKTDGSLWLWGNNTDGQIGNGETSRIFVKEPVKLMEDVAAVSCGRGHAAAIKTDGSLWVWGDNRYCSLGVETEPRTVTFAAYPIPTPTKLMDGVRAVCCADDYTAVLKEDGSLWTWGRARDYILGTGAVGLKGEGPHIYRDKPAKVMDDVAAMSCGDTHMAAVKTDGSLWLWGENYRGQLGFGDDKERKGPLKLMEHVAAVSCGSDFTAAIREDGSLWMWGNNAAGQLGNGYVGNAWHLVDCPHQTIPVKIMDNVSTVRCGYDFTVAVKADGSVWSWGNSESYGLGNDGVYDFIYGARTNLPVYMMTVPTKIFDNAAVPAVYDTPLPDWEPALEMPVLPEETGTAYPATQMVEIDGKGVELQCYALRDEQGNYTNYVKVRDLAAALNGTAAQFEVKWSGEYLDMKGGQAYTPNGTEGITPFSGQRDYKRASEFYTRLNGHFANGPGICLYDDNGGGYTYYQLRDIGKGLGFNVGWSADRGVFLETDKPYDYSN